MRNYSRGWREINHPVPEQSLWDWALDALLMLACFAVVGLFLISLYLVS